MYSIMQVAGFCLTQSYKELRKGKGLQVMEMRATATGIKYHGEAQPLKRQNAFCARRNKAR